VTRLRLPGGPFTFGLLLLSVVLAGCVTSVSSELHEVRREIDQALPEATLESETTFHVGRIALGISRGILRMAGEGSPSSPSSPDSESAAAMLTGLKRVDVGIFRVVGAEAVPERDLVPRIESILERRGWEVIVRVFDGEEAAWVAYQMTGDQLRGFYVIALDEDELSLVRLRGRLDRVLAAAVQAASSHDGAWETL